MRVYFSNDMGLGSHLRRLHVASDRRHQLVDSPSLADIIFVKHARDDVHELALRFPRTCFSLYGSDYPLYFTHGIYTNGEKSIYAKGRVRTGCYQLSHGKNPYVHENVILPLNRKYLASFMGRNCHPVRAMLFDLAFTRQDVFIEDSSTTFNLWSSRQDEKEKAQRQKYFRDVLVDSKFSICPRGSGANSIRLFESMELGVAPVIISDNWILPRGPEWNRFSLILKEAEIANLQEILEAHEEDYEEMGRLAQETYETYFSERAYFNYLVSECAEILDHQWLPESLCRSLVMGSHRSKHAWSRFRRKVGFRSRVRNLLIRLHLL